MTKKKKTAPVRVDLAEKYGADFKDPNGCRVPKKLNWLRRAEKVPAADLALDVNGLPRSPILTVVEAISWRAFGQAIPAKLWAAAQGLDRAAYNYKSARDLLLPAARHHLVAKREARWKVTGFRPFRDPVYETTHGAILVGKPSATTIAFSSILAPLGGSNLGASNALRIWLSRSIKLRAHELECRLKLESATAASKRIALAQMSTNGRTLESAQRELIKAFITGDLVCEGLRPGDEVWDWKPVPQGVFSYPVAVKMTENVFEPSCDADAETRALIAKKIAGKWTDIRIRGGVPSLLAAFRVTDLAPSAGAVASDQLAPAPLARQGRVKHGSRAKKSQSAHDEWYRTYKARCLKASLKPNQPQDEKAAAATVAEGGLGDGYLRDRLRKSRAEFAPRAWSDRGKRR